MKEAQRSDRGHVLAVALSVFVFWLTVSLIPVYNKFFFDKKYYPYPIATAGIQLACVASLAIVISSAQHCLGRGESAERSWIFGPHFWWKLRTVFPVGFLFGIKYGVTNLGLHLVPAPTHLLLQSTDLIWATLGGYFVNGERSSPVGLLCIVGCVAGSVVLSIQVGQDVSAPALAIAINLGSPVLLGFVVAALRAACVTLMDTGNRVGGTVSSAELTAIKLCISSTVAFILAIFLEGGGGWKDGRADDGGVGWAEAFRALAPATRAGVLGGSLIILVFQVNCTYLAHLTSTIAVGLVAQLKIIPQWAVATTFSFTVHHFHPTGLNFVGAALTMASAALYAVHKYASRGKGVPSDADGGDGSDPSDRAAFATLPVTPSRASFITLGSTLSYGSTDQGATPQA